MGDEQVQTKLVVALGVALIVSACSVQKEWVETNASRADGTVTLAYEYGGLQTRVIDPEQGTNLAKTSCSDWGYTGAKPLATMSQCTMTGQYGCMRFMVSQRYQCLGAPSASKAL